MRSDRNLRDTALTWVCQRRHAGRSALDLRIPGAQRTMIRLFPRLSRLLGRHLPSHKQRQRVSFRYRPSLESLEDRVLLNTYTVTSTADSGMGTLRQAILDANGHAGTDTITFNLAGSGVQTIAPLSALPTISGAVILDGTTQPGYKTTPLIEINGANITLFADGLD